MAEIFICSRKDDGSAICDQIATRLATEWGEAAIFRDVEFRRNKGATQQIIACEVMLVVIGASWIGYRSIRQRRHYDFPRAYVVNEIDTAFTCRKAIIPILIEGAQMPTPDLIPSNIVEFCTLKALSVRSGEFFDDDLQHLMSHIRQTLFERRQPNYSNLPTLHPQPSFEYPSADDLRDLFHLCSQTLTQNADWKPILRRFNGSEMCLVPPGRFMMGSTISFNAAAPVHQQTIPSPFWIGRYPVTNAEYAEFMEKSGYDRRPRDYDGFTAPDQPRVGVTWSDAMFYCSWRGGHLPNEAEWEYAARGLDGLLYPWGNEYTGHEAVSRVYTDGKTWPVTTKPEGASWVGAMHLSGNVEEWQLNVFRPYPFVNYSEDDVIEYTQSRVLRGASWLHFGDVLFGMSTFQASRRRATSPIFQRNDVGFRLVLPFSDNVHNP